MTLCFRIACGRPGRGASAIAIACLLGCTTERNPAGEPLAVSKPVEAAAGIRELRFGVQPIHDSRLLWSRWSGLMGELNARCTGFRLRLESALTETTYHSRVQSGELDLVLVEPHLVVPSEALGYRVFARVAAEDRIGGVLVVRNDVPIRRPRDLAGKRVAFGRADALASTMLVRHWVREETGFDLAKVCNELYLGSEDAALRALAIGDADAAGVSRAAWERLRNRYPHWIPLLQARWATDTLSGPALMAHQRVSEDEVRQLRRALVSLNTTENGRTAVAQTEYHGFRPASSSSYDDVWEFVAYYARVFSRSGDRG